MNEAELAANPMLEAWVVHDLNQQPDFSASLGTKASPGKAASKREQAPKNVGEEEMFDAVICNVSIDYLTRPLEIMRSIATVLKPGGHAYLAISNRCFPTKVSSCLACSQIPPSTSLIH